MEKPSILAIDIAKQVFQVCATTETGEVIYNRSYSRTRLAKLLDEHPKALVAMEACSTAHFWGRFASDLGHDVKLIPPIYVKPFVKRSKNDANDALGIATAVRQPGMRFVAVKSVDQQSRSTVFKTHQTLTRQRAQLITTLRSHLTEFGVIIPKNDAAFYRFEEEIEDRDDVPLLVLETARMYYAHIGQLNASILTLERQMKQSLAKDENSKRVLEIPGVGPITTAAVAAFAPPLESFQCGRDFAAWLGLVPRQLSSGGKTRLGKMTKMGQAEIRRLLIVGGMSVIRWATIKGLKTGSWFERILSRKPKKVVAVALANKLARTIWAVTTKQEAYSGRLVLYG